MCGIFGGIIEKDKLEHIQSVFISELRSRGPDFSSVYYDSENNVVLGHTRLSIIDLSSAANQPMKSEDGNFVITYNGEIYNYMELKRFLIEHGFKFRTNSDTETLLNGFVHSGIEFIKKCRGMFAFCIYDRKNKKLHLVRDRFGIKPLIYTFSNGYFFFSSELQPFIHSDVFSKNISPKGLYYFIKYGSARQPWTILDGFFQLLPGHYLVYDIGTKEYRIFKYYDLIEESKGYPVPKDYDEAVESLKDNLLESAKYHMVSDVELGAFLSGGTDSTTVVALMRKLSNTRIKTFTVGFSSKTYVYDETEISKKTAEFLDCEHYSIKVDNSYIKDILDDFIQSIDQPSIDGINTFIVSRETSRKVKVALSGLGGDEIFGGYPHFRYIKDSKNIRIGLLSKLFEKIYDTKPNRLIMKYAFSGIDEESAVDKFRTINRRANMIINREFLATQTEDKLFHTNSEHHNLSTIQKISSYEINNYLRDTLLRDTDAVSMAHSLEVRPVLLDHKLVEFVFNLPDEYKIKNGIQKSILIDSVKSIVPESVWRRPKTGFDMPYRDWLNNTFNRTFYELVESANAKRIFSRIFLEQLKFRIRNRITKTSDWMFLILLSWLDRKNIKV